MRMSLKSYSTVVVPTTKKLALPRQRYFSPNTSYHHSHSALHPCSRHPVQLLETDPRAPQDPVSQIWNQEGEALPPPPRTPSSTVLVLQYGSPAHARLPPKYLSLSAPRQVDNCIPISTHPVPLPLSKVLLCLTLPSILHPYILKLTAIYSFRYHLSNSFLSALFWRPAHRTNKHFPHSNRFKAPSPGWPATRVSNDPTNRSELLNLTSCTDELQSISLLNCITTSNNRPLMRPSPSLRTNSSISAPPAIFN
jgi:hypothetical protein